MIVRTAAERPMVFAVAFLDGKVIDAGNAKTHQAVLVEFPVFVAVAAIPMPAIVMPFIGEAHGDAVFAKGPDFLDEAVVEFAIPLARQERFDCLTALGEFRAVSPPAVDRVSEGDPGGISRIPCVFGHTRLLRGGFGGERRKRRAVHARSSVDVLAQERDRSITCCQKQVSKYSPTRNYNRAGSFSGLPRRDPCMLTYDDAAG